jgi:hypothetical protein
MMILFTFLLVIFLKYVDGAHSPKNRRTPLPITSSLPARSMVAGGWWLVATGVYWLSPTDGGRVRRGVGGVEEHTSGSRRGGRGIC